MKRTKTRLFAYDGEEKYSTIPIKKLMALLNNPQDKFDTIHIGGTNGKGSIINFIGSSLKENNINTAMMISPYIQRINEMMVINGEEISDTELKEILNLVMDKADKIVESGTKISPFEILTGAGFYYFGKKNVDIALIEVAMGGRNDATNIINSKRVGFTSISKDHTNILGSTLSEIADIKGDIIKENSLVFSYPQEKEIKEILSKKAKERNAEINFLDKNKISNIKITSLGNSFHHKDFGEIETKLIGEHQIYNASLALEIINSLKSEYKLDDKKIIDGIKKAKNPGRLESIEIYGKNILLDGSHNLASLEELIKTLKEFNYSRLILGFSLLADKDVEKIIKRIIPFADELVLTIIDNPRALNIKELEKEVKTFKKDYYAFTNRKKALEKTIDLANEKDLILWCGSLYLIGDIRNLIEEMKRN